ncbi:DUF4240 domain-containing protein [Flavobacterium sp. 245]|uniref:DUF4240 domain-containing protein n=1 Tax=Flavobacterium sp. 245 TaxID=2512115 RepID=UPI00105F75F2|nr:DUF4240 domain-containing protein [Flavobacterium sp. 245]TDO96144.1 uncharacterized protein DUF4240 [Flavobacterium sp. 245]
MTSKRALIKLLLIIQILVISCEKKEHKKTLKTHQYINLISSDTTGKVMKEDEFWKLIDQSRIQSNDNYELQTKVLKEILLKLKAEEIEKFDNTFTALLAASYNWDLLGASYVINGGCFDDCFDYFRQNLIAHGKEKFYDTIANPDDCVYWIKSQNEELWNGIQYSAYDAYKEKTGKEIPKTYNPDWTLKGEEFDENNIEKKYPKLAKKFL